MRTWYHSADDGKTWSKIEVKSGSLLNSLDLAPGELHNDGYGNTYKYDDDKETSK